MRGVLLLTVVFFFSATLAQTDSEPLFTRIAPSESGISFQNNIVQSPGCNYLYYDYLFNGGGVAVGDINNDGLPDVYFTGNQVSNKLYLNQGDFKFKDITSTANAGGWDTPRKTWSTGVSMVDVNGDGWLDIYVCKSGPINEGKFRKNELYINNCDLTFTERGEEYGIADSGFSTQASFFDYDLDGDLDLYVANHSVDFYSASSTIFENKDDEDLLQQVSGKLYQNQGDNTFKDVSKEAGILKYGWNLGVVTSDINSDGYPDIYVSNDFSIPDFLFINDGKGGFKDKVAEHTKHVSYYSMGCDVGDINNDGNQDLYVVDMTAADYYRSKTLMPSMNPSFFGYLTDQMGFHHQYMFNALQLNNGQDNYSDIAQMAGVHKTDWSWACLIADFDNDTYNDIFVSNGVPQDAKNNDFLIAYKNRLSELGVGLMPPSEIMEWVNRIPSQKIPNYLFHNKGDLSFGNKTKDWGLHEATFSNGATYADLDNDGDLDLLVNNIDEDAFVYRNNAFKKGRHYVQLELKGDRLNRDGLNAKVYVYADGVVQVKENLPTRGFQSSVDARTLHFGLKSTKVDSIIVNWSNDCTDILTKVKANQKIQIKRNCGENWEAAKCENTLFTELSGKGIGLDHVHKENRFDEFKKEILLPHKQSTLGPFTAVGDINGDKLDDVFVGGAGDEQGALFTQRKGGSFEKLDGPWQQDFMCEDIGAVFFDADGNGWKDLYVVSGGGGEYETHEHLLQDRLYLNMGKGRFEKSEGLPEMLTSGSQVYPFDYDNDGDLDLLVAGRLIPGSYPAPPKSYLLQNEGGVFTDVTATVAPVLSELGLVNGAVWTDFNGDDKTDLIVVGEWMPITFIQNKGERFEDVTAEYGLSDYRGWWNCVRPFDFDNDGDLDYVLGNIGLNNKFKPSMEKPLKLFYNDFDQNGVGDIVLASKYNDQEVPVRGRQCSSEQMPFIKDKFTSYHDFATAGLSGILGQDNLSQSLSFQVTTFEHAILVNEGGQSYKVHALPRATQMAPINDVVFKDLDGNGYLDMIYAGNRFGAEVETERYDAGYGGVLMNEGNLDFKNLSINTSGFNAPGNVKDLNEISIGGKPHVLVTNNDGALQLFRIE